MNKVLIFPHLVVIVHLRKPKKTPGRVPSLGLLYVDKGLVGLHGIAAGMPRLQQVDFLSLTFALIVWAIFYFLNIEIKIVISSFFSPLFCTLHLSRISEVISRISLLLPTISITTFSISFSPCVKAS